MKEDATTAVKAAQQVLKDVRAVFTQKSKATKEAKALAADAKAKALPKANAEAALPKAKGEGKSGPSKRATGKQAGK